MKISKSDALIWFDYFSQMSENDQLTIQHEEIIYATFAQIEAAIDQRNEQCADDRAPDVADASGEGRAADDDRCDDVEFVADAEFRHRRHHACGEKD